MKYWLGIVAVVLSLVFNMECNANIFNKIGDAIGNAAEKVGEKASEIKENVEEKVEETKEKIEEKIEEKKEAAEERADDDDSDDEDGDEEEDDDDSDDEDDDDSDDNDNDDKENKDGNKGNGSNKNTLNLSAQESKQRIAELRDNAQAMKDKEQSTENKLLGAAAIGATGIGGMQMASAMSEQTADDAAERDMRAYLATFRCDYGAGRNITGGAKNIELPDSDALIQYVTEYKQLAVQLKSDKEALGLPPGIESEIVQDAATTGLYDNVSVGKTGGAFTSLSRAIMDENSADAAAWDKQKSDTASQKKTGTIIAAMGAIGGAVGNLALNSGADKKNKVDEIENKYKKISDNNKIKTSGDAAPSATSGADSQEKSDDDECELTGVLNQETGRCACGENTVRQGNNCTCDQASGYFYRDGFCVSGGTQPSPDA